MVSYVTSGGSRGAGFEATQTSRDEDVTKVTSEPRAAEAISSARSDVAPAPAIEASEPISRSLDLRTVAEHRQVQRHDPVQMQMQARLQSAAIGETTALRDGPNPALVPGLPREAQGPLDVAAPTYGALPSFAEAAADMGTDASFLGLEPEVQARAWAQMGNLADGGPASAPTYARMVTADGFAELGLDEQDRLMDYVGADADFVGERAREGFYVEAEANGFDAAPPAEQARQLREYMVEQPLLADGIAYPEGHADADRRPYTLSDSIARPDWEFDGSTEDAQIDHVDIGAQRVRIISPARPDPAQGYMHSVEEVARGLAALPPEDLALITDVTMNPVPNPGDAAFRAGEYGADHESYLAVNPLGHVTVYPTQAPNDQTGLDVGLRHEAGHLQAWKAYGADFASEGWQGYAAAMAADGLDVSRYGEINLDEDFAETLTLYRGVVGTPAEAEIREVYPNRFAELDAVLGTRP